MKWYDIIAPIYDKAIRSLYLPYRQKVIKSLELHPGQTVLDLGWSTFLRTQISRERYGNLFRKLAPIILRNDFH